MVFSSDVHPNLSKACLKPDLCICLPGCQLQPGGCIFSLCAGFNLESGLRSKYSVDLSVCHLKWQSTWIEFSSEKSLVLFEGGNSVNKKGAVVPDQFLIYVSGLTLETKLNPGHIQ